MFEWLNNWRCIALTFVPRAPTEHNLWRRMHVHVCVSLSGPPHPLPSASWHPFSCFTSSTRLFAFSSLSRWTFSVFHYTEDEQDRIFFFCLWQLVYVFLHASFFKQALHTVAGLTLHCWGPLTTYWSQIAFRIHSLADLRTAASPK